MPTRFRVLDNFLPTITRVVELRRRKSQPVESLSLSQTPIADPTESSDESYPAVSEMPASIPPSTEVTAEMSRTEVSVRGGQHDHLKSTDVWFNIELSKLERFALDTAQLHAQAGLPRMDCEAPEELAAEGMLRARAVELFIEWKGRVVRKVQDSLQASVLDAGNAVVNLRHAIDQARLSQHKAAKFESELKATKASHVGRQRTVEYGRRIPHWLYISLIVILTMVEWVANVPIFRELLPMDKGADQALLNIAAQSERYPFWGGVYRMFGKLVFTPEAAILALGTILILMYLTHVCGESRRRIVAFREDDDPGIAHGLKSQNRQARTAFIKSAAGICFILIFLFSSRALLNGVAKKNLDRAIQHTTEISELRKKAIADEDFKEAARLSKLLEEAKDAQTNRDESAAYSTGISALNIPIFLLNCALVTVAIIAAYQDSEGRQTETSVSDPAVQKLEANLDSIYTELMGHRHRVRQLDLQIQGAISQARYLSQMDPTRDWEAKVERLNALIPLFRAENARVRGIDVQNIRAFRLSRPIELGEPEKTDLILPPDLSDCEKELDRLRQNLDFLRSDLLANEAGGKA